MTTIKSLWLLLNTAAIVCCLPITSTPLDTNPDHLAWDELLTLETKNIEYEEVRKIPKSIFITPNLNDTKIICRPGYKLHQDGKCYWINNFNIDPLDILKTQIESLLNVDKNKPTVYNDYEEYDYDSYDSTDTNMSFHVPLTLNFPDEQKINNTNKTMNSTVTTFPKQQQLFLVTTSNALSHNNYTNNSDKNQTFQNSSTKAFAKNKTQSEENSQYAGAINSTVSTRFSNFTQDMVQSVDELEEYDSHVSIISINDTVNSNFERLKNVTNIDNEHVVVTDIKDHKLFVTTPLSLTKMTKNPPINADELNIEAFFEHSINIINNTMATMPEETTDIYPSEAVADEKENVAVIVPGTLNTNYNNMLPMIQYKPDEQNNQITPKINDMHLVKNVTRDDDIVAATTIIADNNVQQQNSMITSQTNLQKTTTKNNIKPKIQLKLSMKTNSKSNKDDVINFPNSFDKKAMESIIKQENNENSINAIDETNRFVYSQFESSSAISNHNNNNNKNNNNNNNKNNTIYYPLSTPTATITIVKPSSIIEQINKIIQFRNDSTKSITFKANANISDTRSKFHNKLIKQQLNSHNNKLIFDQHQTKHLMEPNPNNNKHTVNLTTSIALPLYHNINAKSTLSLFNRNSSAINYSDHPRRENSKSPKEKFFKEVPTSSIDVYTILGSANYNKNNNNN